MAERALTVPLSAQQDELLAKMRRPPDASSGYDSLTAYRIDGTLDDDCLRAALVDLARRHPSLRTAVGTDRTGERHQVVRPGWDAERNFVSSGGSPVGELWPKLLAGRYRYADVLDGRPLFRVGVHRDAAATYLYLAAHHFICDGWSMAILLRDLGELYLAREQGRGPALLAPAASYADYVADQQQAWAALGPAATAYWHAQLAGCTGAPAWPGAGDGPAAGGGPAAGARLRVDLGPAAVDTVHALAATVRTTPFVVLAAATAAGIADVTGDTDLVLDTDVASREDPRTANLVGFVLNTRVTGVRVGRAAGMAELAAAIRDSWQAGERYRDIYGGLVLDALGIIPTIKVDAGGPPGVDGRAFRHPRLRLRREPLPTATHHWREIMVQWRQTPGRLALELWHRPPRVTAQAAEQIAAAVLDRLSEPSGRLDARLAAGVQPAGTEQSNRSDRR
jgi:hypothetical protein